MRRIALFSDVHANLAALDAVLADIARARPDATYCLGDLVGYGPHPAEVIERMQAVGIPSLQGNYDEGIGTRRGDCGCYYANDRERELGKVAYALTAAAVDDEHAAWLAALPQHIEFECDGVRVLLVHGSPRKINEYLGPDRTDAQLARLADQADADVIAVGHVHVPYHRSLAAPDGRRVHYVSDGSVGKPKDGDPRACWAELALCTAEEASALDFDDPAAGPAGSLESTCAAPSPTARGRSHPAPWVTVRFHRVAYDAGRAGG